MRIRTGFFEQAALTRLDKIYPGHRPRFSAER